MGVSIIRMESFWNELLFEKILIDRYYSLLMWYESSVFWDCCEIENALYIILRNNNT